MSTQMKEKRNYKKIIMNIEENEVRDLLETYSTKCYFIEFGGFLSNHIAYGIIALAKLGGSKDRIHQFIQWYETKLEKPEENPNEMSLPETQSQENFDYETLLGQRKAYYPLLEYYRKNLEEECKGSLEVFISKHLPRMIEGISCSALHPLITTAYGYNVKCPKMVLEGITYLHHSYLRFALPEHSVFGQGTQDMLDVLEDVRLDDELCSFNKADEDQIKWFSSDYDTSDFQKRLAILSHSRLSLLISYADRIQLPPWFKIDRASIADVMKLCDWIFDQAVAVYTGSERRNDFFLLHGITGAWSLKEVFSAMKDTPVEVLIKCVQQFVYVLVAVYITQNRPKILPAYLSEKVEEPWEQIIQDALNSEIDEHIYKLAVLCHERALTYPPDQQDIFKRCALLPLQLDYIF